jgi:hypothetical protein
MSQTKIKQDLQDFHELSKERILNISPFTHQVLHITPS